MTILIKGCSFVEKRSRCDWYTVADVSEINVFSKFRTTIESEGRRNAIGVHVQYWSHTVGRTWDTLETDKRWQRF
jgi:hypothetical protein